MVDIPYRPNHPEFRWEDIFNYSDTSDAKDSRTPATSSVFVLPKGSLLFSYDNLFGGQSEEEFIKLSELDKTAIMMQQMTRLSLADSFSWNKTSKRFEVKSARTMATLKYFYPTPYGGLGVQTFGDMYNCCWVVMTTCDICVAEPISAVSSDLVKLDKKTYDAYFQDGVSTSLLATKPYLKDANIQHRRFRPLHTNNYYDFKFLDCNTIPNALTARIGNGYDVCLDYAYSEAMLLSGVKGIAGSDSIISLNEKLLKPIYDVKNMTENIEHNSLNKNFNAFVALQEAKIALQHVDMNGTIFKQDDLAFLNTAFFLSDRSYDDKYLTRLNISIPEYSLNPFGNDHIRNHKLWANNDDVSDTYTFPYDQWGIYLRGGIQKDWIQTNTPIPEKSFMGVFKNCKIIPIGVLLSSSETDPYRFINFKNLKFKYRKGIKTVTQLLQPTKISFPIKTFYEEPRAFRNIEQIDPKAKQNNEHRIRSFYISSLEFFNSFENKTVWFNSLKKLFFIKLNHEGFDKNVACYNWDTTLNKIKPFNAPLLNYSCIPYSSNISGFIKACIIKDLIQTYLAVKYRHLKYNKGIYNLTDKFHALFFDKANLMKLVNDNFADVKIESTLMKDWLMFINNDLFDDVHDFFQPIDCYLPNVNFSALFPLPIDHNDDNTNIDTVNDNVDTVICYFYRRFFIMFLLEKSKLSDWSSCTQISLVFLVMIYVAENSKIALLDFQHSVLVPAGFDIFNNDIENTHNEVYKNDLIIDKLTSNWTTKQFKSTRLTSRSSSKTKSRKSRKSRKSNKSRKSTVKTI